MILLALGAMGRSSLGYHIVVVFVDREGGVYSGCACLYVYCARSLYAHLYCDGLVMDLLSAIVCKCAIV